MLQERARMVTTKTNTSIKRVSNKLLQDNERENNKRYWNVRASPEPIKDDKLSLLLLPR